MQDRRLTRYRILPDRITSDTGARPRGFGPRPFHADTGFGVLAERCPAEVIGARPARGDLLLPDNDNEAVTGGNACKASALSARCAWNRGISDV